MPKEGVVGGTGIEPSRFQSKVVSYSFDRFRHPRREWLCAHEFAVLNTRQDIDVLGGYPADEAQGNQRRPAAHDVVLRRMLRDKLAEQS